MGKNEELEKELRSLQDRVQIEKSASQVEFNTFKKRVEERESTLMRESDKKIRDQQKEVIMSIYLG